jgi:hypothetical protein
MFSGNEERLSEVQRSGLLIFANNSTLCESELKRLKFSNAETGSDVSLELALQLKQFVITLYLSICGFSAPSIFPLECVRGPGGPHAARECHPYTNKLAHALYRPCIFLIPHNTSQLQYSF